MGEAKRKKKSSLVNLSLTKNSTAMTVFIVIVVLIVSLDFYQRSNKSPLNDFDPTRSKGNPSAEIRIVEFVDFQCSECARGSRMLEKYIKEFPDYIYLTVKYFPLGELNSTISAVYAQCAANQDMFWPYHDMMFQFQDSWRALLRIRPYLAKMATSVGINVDELESCVETDEVRRQIIDERAIGESNLIKMTPSYFYNGELVVGVEGLKKKLESYFKDLR